MMDAMKDSGIRWIGEIPESWNTKRIKYVANLKGRIGWQGLTSEEYQDEGAFLITGVDFLDSGIDWENCVHVPMKRWEEAKDIQIEEGDLLITKDGTVGKVAIVKDMPGETSLNSGVLRIMPIEGYSRRFLYWVIQSEEFWNWFNYKNAGNSTIVHLYQGDFAEFLYAFPEYTEQEAVSDYLDRHCAKIDGIISDLKRQIETLQKYEKSLITETVTKGLDKCALMKDSGVDWIGKIPEQWEIKKIKYLFDLHDEKNYLPLEDVNLISLYTDLGVVQHDDLEATTGNKAHNADGYKIVHKDDIVVNIILCWMGAVGRSEYDGVTSPAYDVYKPKKHVCSRFYHYLFRTSGFNGECYAVGRGIMAMRWRTYSSEFRNIKVVLPPLNVQEKIADYLDRKCGGIDETIQMKKEQLSVIENHKKSLIFEYVTGKKRVKEAMQYANQS